MPIGRVAALSGPNLAAEVARNLPASAVVAAADLGARRARRRADRAGVGSGSTSTRTSSASSCAGRSRTSSPSRPGAADALGFGDNGKAGLLTRGLAEMTRLGIAAGANPLTFAGLAGMGDLIATCGLAPVAQPPARRGAGQGPDVGRDRGDACRARPRAPTPSSAALGAGRAPRRRDADRPRGRARAVRGQERPALPGRPARPRVEGRARRLRPLGRAPGGRRRGLRRPMGDRGPGARLRVRRGVAQSGSAPVWGTGGRGFKSRRPDQHPSVRPAFGPVSLFRARELCPLCEQSKIASAPTVVTPRSARFPPTWPLPHGPTVGAQQRRPMRPAGPDRHRP